MENKKEEDQKEQQKENLSDDIIPEEVLQAFPEEDRGRISSLPAIHRKAGINRW